MLKLNVTVNTALRLCRLTPRTHISLVRPMIRSRRTYQTTQPQIELPASMLEQIERMGPINPLIVFAALLIPMYATYKYITRPDPEKAIPSKITEINNLINDINQWRAEFEEVVLEEDEEDSRVGVLGGTFAQVDDDISNSYLAIMTQKQLKFVALYRKLLTITTKLKEQVLGLEDLCHYCNSIFLIRF
jgi:hypothetical protein